MLKFFKLLQYLLYIIMQTSNSMKRVGIVILHIKLIGNIRT